MAKPKTFTDTNLHVLVDWVGADDGIAIDLNRVPPAEAPHLRRAIDLGLLEPVPKQRGIWSLTAAGRQAVGILDATDAAVLVVDRVLERLPAGVTPADVTAFVERAGADLAEAWARVVLPRAWRVEFDAPSGVVTLLRRDERTAKLAVHGAGRPIALRARVDRITARLIGPDGQTSEHTVRASY